VLLHDANLIEFKLSLHANCIGFWYKSPVDFPQDPGYDWF
jgi:hypothetical protein